MKRTILSIVVVLGLSGLVNGQMKEEVSPGMAFLKSAVLPGWGETSIGGEAAGQGWWHMSADVIMIAGLFGLNMYVDNARENMFTYAHLNSGVDIQERSRSYQLAVGRYEDIYEYNDAMERQRRWTAIYPETDEYIWVWDNDEQRQNYQSQKRDLDLASNQIPGVVTLMVINRVWSGLNAFLEARDYNANLPAMSVSPVQGWEHGQEGWTLNMQFNF